MTDKEVIIDDMQKTIERLQKECTEKTDNIIALSEQLQRKEQECEELRQYHNKCCEEHKKEIEEWLKKYNQVARDFFNGMYCDKEHCNLVKIKEQENQRLQAENEELKKKLKSYTQGWIECDKERNLQEANSEFRQRVIDRYKQALEEIKEIAAEINLTIMGGNASPKDEWVELYTNTCLKIILKINEVLKYE